METPGRGLAGTGLADAIVDLISTGNTLRANRLKAVEELAPVSARLIVNPAAGAVNVRAANAPAPVRDSIPAVALSAASASRSASHA